MAASCSEEWDEHSESAGLMGSLKGCGLNPESSKETLQNILGRPYLPASLNHCSCALELWGASMTQFLAALYFSSLVPHPGCFF